MGFGDGFVGDVAVHDVEAADEGGLVLAGFGEEFDVAASDAGKGLGGGVAPPGSAKD